MFSPPARKSRLRRSVAATNRKAATLTPAAILLFLLAALFFLSLFINVYVVFAPLSSNPVTPLRNLASATNSLTSAAFQSIPCPSRSFLESLVQSVNEDPFAINEWRRRVYLYTSKECISQHFPFFQQQYQKRRASVPNKHVSLHIPRAGGTSLCSWVEDHSDALQLSTSSDSNCWIDNFCPLWCGCSNPKPTTCQDINNMPDFVMNENWLDVSTIQVDQVGSRTTFCKDRLYSILVRDPIPRTMSHVQLFLNAVAARGHEHFQHTTSWRLHLIQSNYMVWALSASTSSTNEPRYHRPQLKDLEIAKENLMKMDYVLDIVDDQEKSHNDDTEYCTHIFLKQMGLWLGDNKKDSTNTDGGDNTDSVGHENSHGQGYQDHHDPQVFRLLNDLDIHLFEFAKRVMKVDCQFFRTIQQSIQE